MKKDKGFVDDRAPFSWEDMIKEREALESEKNNKEKLEWDRPLVDENWTIDNTGEIPKAGPTDSKTGLRAGSVTALLPPEDAIYNAMLSEDLDLSAQLSQSLNKVMDKNEVDEKAIRSSVDQKIVIKSEELKNKRTNKDGTPRKVRRRIPKNSDETARTDKGQPLSDTANQTSSKKRGEKYKHTELEKKPEMSDFRAKSMNWKDGESPREEAHAGEAFDIIDAADGFFAHFKKYIPLQWVALALAVVIVITAAMTTGVYASYKGEQNRALALKSLEKYAEVEDNTSTEAYVEEELGEATASPEEIVEIKTLSLVLASVEKDLKIKLVDQDDTLVKDVNWGVIVTDADGKISDNDDEDRDGVIYLTEINAGDYSVELKESDDLKDYILPQSSQMVSVKAKVEYKVIANIKDEIKSEKEVNAAVEDNGNKPADVETAPVSDTVEWVESTKTSTGEKYVESAVALELTAKADSVKNYLAMGLDRLCDKIMGKQSSVIGMPLLVADNEEPGGNSGDGGGNTAEPTPTPTPEPTAEPTPSPEPTPETTPTPTPSPEPTAVLVETVTLDKTTASIKVGESVTINAAIAPENAANKAVEWKSSDASVAKVENGKVTAVKAGNADITATSTDGSNKSAVCKVTVTAADTSIKVKKLKISPAEASVAVKANYQLAYTWEPNNATDTKVKWEIADKSIATITDGGLVTGVKEGTTKVTITANDGSGVKAECTIKVTPAVLYADTAQLYDKDKNPLYKQDGDKYVLAKYKDYKANNSIKLFKKTEGFLYTGWQTIDGKTYYYKKDNNYVTGDQIIGGVTYHFATDGSLTQGSGTLGIDVSKYQPSINWSSVKDSGVSFVIIRCGYRGSSTGVLVQDPYFTSHIKGAKAAGLKVGIYFFTTAVTEAEAIEEASMCAYLCSGYGINYPVFIDCESSNRPGYNGMGVEQRTQIIKAFCNTIKSAGYTPGVYSNKTWFTEKINASALSGYKIWLAQYNSAGPTYKGRYDLWQYTSKGSVPGISGNVDMNQSYLGY